jgi:hypothetical protein
LKLAVEREKERKREKKRERERERERELYIRAWTSEAKDEARR